ncbi:hypothetical protein BH18VER1_BH18VER1_12630 [soil metagenome]
MPQVHVRFLPHRGAFENVIAQMKSGSVAYSVFALARLFLEKPERYEVRLTGGDGVVLHQLGTVGPAAVESRILEGGAFAAMRDEFYTVEETQTGPIKGNFSNVARDRVSGALLGPTNHHSYQPQLRSLYEQRYSRRMSFQDFQRQIEIVSDPAVVEQWKEQARSVTTYTTKNQEPAVTFNSAAEAERHFRQAHLPTLIRSEQELTVSGVVSRRLPDRGLARLIEDAWAAEIRSPSKMMQELAGGLRAAGLNIFRHRRGMLFVSPIRMRSFGHERTGVSPSINSILEKVTEAPGINRKGLANQLTTQGADEAEQERVKRTLVADLHWLISEGYVIEFNDGTLDVPRSKPPTATAAGAPHTSIPEPQAQSAAPAPEMAAKPSAAGPDVAEAPATPLDSDTAAPSDERRDAGDEMGMVVEQSIEPTDVPTPAEANEIDASASPPEAQSARTEPFASSARTEADEAENDVAIATAGEETVASAAPSKAAGQ